MVNTQTVTIISHPVTRKDAVLFSQYLRLRICSQDETWLSLSGYLKWSPCWQTWFSLHCSWWSPRPHFLNFLYVHISTHPWTEIVPLFYAFHPINLCIERIIFCHHGIPPVVTSSPPHSLGSQSAPNPVILGSFSPTCPPRSLGTFTWNWSSL